MKFARSVITLLTLVWLGVALFITRHAMLDDALIHLRYATNLHNLHILTYDGVTATFGCSSLLWVSLLALLRGLTSSPLLGKWLSVCAYLALLGVLYALHRRARGPSSWILLILFAATLTPMAIRWLTDGMETSLEMLLVTLLAIVVSSNERFKSPAAVLLKALFSASIVLLRIELLSLIAIAGLLCFLAAQTEEDRISFRAGLWRALPFWTGGAAAILWVRMHFGAFLPDTALAKTGVPLLLTLKTTVLIIVSSFSFGIGYMLLYGVSLALLWRFTGTNQTKLHRVTVLVANSPFILLIVLAAARGQMVQGVRYVLWAVLFSIVWNCYEIHQRFSAAIRNNEGSQISYRGLVYALCGVILLLLPLDAFCAFRPMMSRAKTFEEMQVAGLERLHGKNLIAGDVGFIGYFTQANICDMSGLVNGRAFAVMSVDERIATCVTHGIDAAFVNDWQFIQIQRKTDMMNGTVCLTYDFHNAYKSDLHYLVARDRGNCGAEPLPNIPVRGILPSQK